MMKAEPLHLVALGVMTGPPTPDDDGPERAHLITVIFTRAAWSDPTADGIEVELEARWLTATTRTRSRALKELKSLLELSSRQGTIRELAELTDISTGRVSEMLRFADLDRPIAEAVDRIRDRGSSIDQTVLEQLPYGLLRPFLRSRGTADLDRMIEVAYRAQLAGRSRTTTLRLMTEGGDDKREHTRTAGILARIWAWFGRGFARLLRRRCG